MILWTVKDIHRCWWQSARCTALQLHCQSHEFLVVLPAQEHPDIASALVRVGYSVFAGVWPAPLSALFQCEPFSHFDPDESA